MKAIQLFIVLITTTVFSVSCVLALETGIEVYKSPYCGCCKDWVVHLEQHGFKVTQYSTGNMGEIKTRLGVAASLASCHTAVIDGYVIEGHVPATDIKRLLTDKPKIHGLTVPGMPAGDNVPGMETTAGNARFDVLVLDESKREVFSSYE